MFNQEDLLYLKKLCFALVFEGCQICFFLGLKDFIQFLLGSGFKGCYSHYYNYYYYCKKSSSAKFIAISIIKFVVHWFNFNFKVYCCYFCIFGIVFEEMIYFFENKYFYQFRFRHLVLLNPKFKFCNFIWYFYCLNLKLCYYFYVLLASYS